MNTARRPAVWTRLVHRVGRRGYFLLMLALVDGVYGYRMLWPESPGQAETNRYLADVIDSLAHWPSLRVWAGLWWTAGAFCLFFAFRRQDYPGFGAAFAMKVIWVAANIAAGLDGLPGWGLRTVVWTFIAGTVLVVGKWPEPHNSFPEVMAEMESTGEIRRVRRDHGVDGQGDRTTGGP